MAERQTQVLPVHPALSTRAGKRLLKGEYLLYRELRGSVEALVRGLLDYPEF